MRQALGGLTFLILALGVALFAPAWTSHDWQAWVFLAVFSASGGSARTAAGLSA
jgi:hypothetical protein